MGQGPERRAGPGRAGEGRAGEGRDGGFAAAANAGPIAAAASNSPNRRRDRADPRGDSIIPSDVVTFSGRRGNSRRMFTLDSSGPVARLSLDRPAARNAIAIGQWPVLADCVAQAVDRGARALVVRSAAPNIFSSGADLDDLDGLSSDPALRVRFRTDMARAFGALASAPIATIAAVDGGCYGAGVALAMACDIRVAGDMARFGITPAKVGIVYPAGDVARLAALVGPGQAARLLLSGMTIDADEAREIGLVEERAPSAETAAMQLAGTIAANARSSVAGLKRILAGDPAADRLFDDAFDGADFRDGLTAFRARRSPTFR